jgi:hypothetical protein
MHLKCMMMLGQILAVLCQDVLSNTYNDRWISIEGPTVWLPRSPYLNPLDFYVWRHENPWVAAPVDNEEARVRLSATTSASSNGCGGP